MEAVQRHFAKAARMKSQHDPVSQVVVIETLVSVCLHMVEPATCSKNNGS